MPLPVELGASLLVGKQDAMVGRRDLIFHSTPLLSPAHRCPLALYLAGTLLTRHGDRVSILLILSDCPLHPWLFSQSQVGVYDAIDWCWLHLARWHCCDPVSLCR